MNGLDIVLINVISYLGGILSGIYIHHKMNKNKKHNNDNKKNDNDNLEKDFDSQKYESPILSAMAVPSTPVASAPPLNSNYSLNPNYPNPQTLNKRIIITTD